MAKVLFSKSLGVDDETGSEVIIEIFCIKIDGDNERINIDYRLNFLSPKNIVLKSESNSYSRFNRVDYYYRQNEIITPAVLYSKGDTIPLPKDAKEGDIAQIAKGDEIKIPAILADGTQVKEKGNMKFDQLEESTVGQMIKGMLMQDINTIKNIQTIISDLKQL